MEHELKTWFGPFDSVWRGCKKHEVRANDRGFQVQDTLLLREYDPHSQQYLGRWISVRVTDITHGGSFGLPDDLCVMSIETMLRGGSRKPKSQQSDDQCPTK